MFNEDFGIDFKTRTAKTVFSFFLSFEFPHPLWKNRNNYRKNDNFFKTQLTVPQEQDPEHFLILKLPECEKNIEQAFFEYVESYFLF